MFRFFSLLHFLVWCEVFQSVFFFGWIPNFFPPRDRIASIILRTFCVSSLSQFHKYVWVHKPFKRPSLLRKEEKFLRHDESEKIRAVCMGHVRFMGASGSYWNPWKCKMELSVLLLDGPRRNTWTFWTPNKDFVPVETSRKENPLLHSTSRSCANLGLDWDVSLERSFKSHSLNFLELHFSLFSLSQPRFWAGLAQAKPHREVFLPQDTWDVQRSYGATIPGNAQKTHGYGPGGHNLVVVLSWGVDLRILEVFPSLNDSTEQHQPPQA